jgi:hypothetical protein
MKSSTTDAIITAVLFIILSVAVAIMGRAV